MQLKKIFRYVCVFFILFLPIFFTSQANGIEKDGQNFLLTVPKKRLKCQREFEKSWDTSIYSELTAANYEYGDCLKKIIIEVATRFYPKDAFGDGGIEASIEALQKIRLNLYRNLYNKCKPCQANMWDVMVSEAAFDDLENIIFKMSIRQFFGLEGSDEFIEKFEADWYDDKNE